MQSSKTTGAGTTEVTSKRAPAPVTSTETFLPRGLANASNGAGASAGKGMNGKSRGEADSYYGVSSDHPLTSSYVPPNGGIHGASVYCGTGTEGEGVSGNYNPAFLPTYSDPEASYNTNAIGTGAIPIPTIPTSTLGYNPTPVPQVSPYYPGALPTTASAPLNVSTPLPETHNSSGEAASYYSAPQVGTSVASSYDSTSHQQQNHSGFSHSLESSISGVISAVQAHNHNHNQGYSHNHNNPPPPLRQSVRKLWENLRAEERYAIGQFELYSEVIGICRGCFEPGSSYTEAPRTHHYGQRWTSKGWRVKRKSSRRVWMPLFKSRNASGFTSPSDGSSSSESTASVSDSDISDNTRKRKLERQIRREKRELKRREREELQEQEGYAGLSSRLRRSSGGSNSSVFHSSGGGASGTQWKDISGSGSNGESDHHYTKASTTYLAPGVLRGGDLQKSKESQLFYNPGYGPDGQAHPTYYTEPSPYNDKQFSKSSSSILGGWFGLSSSNRREINRKPRHSSSHVSGASSSTSLPSELFQFSSKSSSAAASDDGLAYGHSPNSLGSKNKSWFFRSVKKGRKDKADKKATRVKEKGDRKDTEKSVSSSSSSSSLNSRSFSSSSSENGLLYGGGYSSHKSGSLDSGSIKGKRSYTGSVAKSFQSVGGRVSGAFGIGKVQRRGSWEGHYGTSGSINRPRGAAVGVGLTQRNSTGESRTLRTSQSVAAVASSSSWWGGTARKSDGYPSQAVTSGKYTTAASTQGGWFQGGGRKSGGWFGGGEAVQATRHASVGSLESCIGSTEGGVAQHSSAISSAIKSYSTIDVTSNTIKRNERDIYMRRQNSGSLVSSEGGSLKKGEIGIQSPREGSQDISSIMAGRRRASSVDSWESFDSSRKPRSRYRRSSATQKPSSTSSGFLSGLFSGKSVGLGERSRSRSRDRRRRMKKMDELKRSEASKKRSGKIVREDANTSTTSMVDISGEEVSAGLQKVYPTATDNPFRFDITKPTSSTSISRQQSEASFVRSDYASEKLHKNQEHQSSKTTITTTTGGKIEGADVVVGGFSSLVGVNQPRRPLPVPIQPVISAQPAITPISSTTTIINNHNITHHTTLSSVVNNNSLSSVSNVAQQVVERSQSQSSTIEVSIQDVATAEASAVAASAAAVRVADMYTKDRAERNERDKREKESEQERVQGELRELRIREEKAAFEQKTKSEKEEKERRTLRIEIEQKEKEENELRVKQEREEKAAMTLKRKVEWEAAERAKDEAARLARIKQDEERTLQIRSDEERKYREWSRLQTLQRQRRERESDELFQRTRKAEGEKEKEKEKARAIQREVEKVKFEVVQLGKLEDEVSNVRLIEVGKRREAESKIHEPEEGKRVQQKINEKRLQDSIEIRHDELFEEQEGLGHRAKILERGRRSQSDIEVHSSKREVQIIETEKIEIIQERKKTVERLQAGQEYKAMELTAQVETEGESKTRVQIEQEKTAQVGTEGWQKGLTTQIAAGEQGAMLRGEGTRQGESRRERRQRIVEVEAHEKTQAEIIRSEQAIEGQSGEEWQNMTEEERLIHASFLRRRELERGEEERIKLEEQAADLQRRIAKQEARRARSRARSDDPGYKEREARRSRERSRARETGIEKARREEIAFVRKNIGLDKIEKKEKKKRYNAADPLPTQDIPGFTERSWTVPFGVPILLQTCPTPPPGTPKYPQVLHCKGSNFSRMAGVLDRNLIPAPDIFMVQPVDSKMRQESSVESEERVEGLAISSRSVETVQSVKQEVVGTSSITTAKPFMGTPFSPVPTVAPGYNIGAAVIDYQQKEDSKGYDQNVYFGPELPENFVSPSSSVVYRASTMSGSRSQSSIEHASSDFNTRPRFSEVVYGPVLPPTLESHRGSYDEATTVSSERRSESSYERASSAYSHDQKASTAGAEPKSPAVQTPYRSIEAQSFQIPGAFDEVFTADTLEDNSRESRTVSAPVVPTYRPGPAGGEPFASVSSRVTHSSGSTTRSSSTFNREVTADVKETSRKYQTSSSPTYRPPLAGEKLSLSESSTTLSTIHSASGSSSTISMDHDFQARPAGVTHESTGLLRKQPGVFAFLDQEATSRGATPTPESLKNVRENGRVLTRERVDADNEFIAIAAASAEQAGFDVGLVLGNGATPKSGIISGHNDAANFVSPSNNVRARSPFMEEIEDEDAPHIKRQLGQHELPVEVPWSQEFEARKKSQSRTDLRSQTDFRSAQSTAHSSQSLRLGSTYQVSTPKALEWVSTHVPLPQPATSSVISPLNASPPSRSVPPAESMAQERKDRVHIAERSAPPSRSASLSSSHRSRMGSVREEGSVERPGVAPRSSSLSRIFRSRKDLNKQDSFSTGYTESLRGSTISVNNNAIRAGVNDEAPDSENVRWEREQSPRNNDELRTLERRTETGEVGGAHDRMQFGSQREEFGEPRRSLERRATEQWSTERQSRDRQPLERRSTEHWSADRRAREDRSLPRRATEQRSTERREQSNERHSRRSMESAYQSQEIDTREQVEGIKDETTNSGSEALAQDKSSKTPKVSTWGKVFSGWGNKSKDETKGEANTVGVGLGRALTQARPDLANPPSHRRSVSETGGQRQRPAGLTRNTTEEWEQVAVTPPQKSRTSSLKDYERVDNDNMSINSAPVALHDASSPYPSEDKADFKRTFDTNLPQHVEARIASFTAPEAGAPEIFASEAEEQPKAKSEDRRPRGFTGFLKAARRLGVGQKGSQTPPHGVEEKPIEIPAGHRPAESSRTDTDISTSTSGFSIRQTEFLEQEGGVEHTWDNSSRGDVEQRTAVEYVPFPTPVDDEGLRKEPETLSRLPLSREMSLKQRSSKSLRREVEESHTGRNEGEMKSSKSWGRMSPGGVESSHHDGTEFGGYKEEYAESRPSLSRRATDQLVEEHSSDRQPLRRRSTEHWSTERQPQDKQPLLRRSTEHWLTEGQSPPRRSAIETTEENEGQEVFGKSPESRLPVKKGQNIDIKVKHSTNLQPHACDGEQVAKTLNCVGKPASALVLTLSEGVDLSSDVKRKQEDTQSFEPPDIFDDRDSPPSYENFLLESPISLICSPTQQQEFIPDTFSFVSRTPSPVLPTATVDIYEYPALPQSNSSSVYNLQSISLEPQDTSFRKAPVFHKEIPPPPLSDSSTHIPGATESFTEPSPNTFPQESEHLTVLAEGSLPAGVAPRMPNNHSLSPANNFPTSPIIGASQLPPLPLSDPSMDAFLRTFEDLPPLPGADVSTSVNHVQELSHIPDSSMHHVDSALSEGLFSIPEEASPSSTLEAQQIPSSPLNGTSVYVPIDNVSGNSSPLSGAGKSYAILASSENSSFSSENTPVPSIAKEQVPSAVLSERIPTHHEPEDIPNMRARLPLSPIYEDQESVEEAPVQKHPPAELSGGVLALHLPPVRPQQPPSEHNFSKEPLVLRERQLQPRRGDSLPRYHSTLLENSVEGFQQPTHQGISFFATPPDLSSSPSSEPQIKSHFGPKSSPSLNDQPPHLPESIPEYTQVVPYPLSPSHALQAQSETTQLELPQLDAAFPHNDTGVLPGPPLIGPSSPVAVTPVPDEMLLRALNDSVFPTMVPEESQPIGVPTPPVAAPKQGLNLSTGFSSSDLSSPLIEVTESIKPKTEIPSLLSQSSPLQLPPSESGLTPDLPETSTKHPEPLHNNAVLSWSIIDELTQAAVSEPFPIASEGTSLTGASTSSPTSPARLTPVLDNFPQSPSSDPIPPYQGPFGFPELPTRDHVSLSPILEELPDSPSITAKGEYFEVLPMSTPTSLSVSMTIQNGIPGVLQHEPLSPVRELAFGHPLESEISVAQHEPSRATNSTLPTVEATVFSDVLEVSQNERPSNIADQPQQYPDTYILAGELEAVPLTGSPSGSLSATVQEDLSEFPRSESSLPVEDRYPTAGHQTLPVTDLEKTTIEVLLSTDAGIQPDQPSENHSPGVGDELAPEMAWKSQVFLPPTTLRSRAEEHDDHSVLPELSSKQPTRFKAPPEGSANNYFEDIFPREPGIEVVTRQSSAEALFSRNEGASSEPKVPVTDEIPTSSHAPTMEPAIVDIPETDRGFPVHDSEYGMESKSVSSCASVDLIQLPPVPGITEGCLTGPENLLLSEDPSIVPSAVSAEPTANGVSETISMPITNTSSPKQTGLVEPEIEHITHHFPIEGTQLPLPHTSGTDSVLGLEGLISPGTNLTLLPPETLAAEIIEIDERPSSPIPTSVSGAPVESVAEELAAELPTQGDETLLQEPIYQLPPVEIKSIVPNTVVEFTENLESSRSAEASVLKKIWETETLSNESGKEGKEVKEWEIGLGLQVTDLEKPTASPLEISEISLDVKRSILEPTGSIEGKGKEEEIKMQEGANLETPIANGDTLAEKEFVVEEASAQGERHAIEVPISLGEGSVEKESISKKEQEKSSANADLETQHLAQGQPRSPILPSTTPTNEQSADQVEFLTSIFRSNAQTPVETETEQEGVIVRMEPLPVKEEDSSQEEGARLNPLIATEEILVDGHLVLKESEKKIGEQTERGDIEGSTSGELEPVLASSAPESLTHSAHQIEPAVKTIYNPNSKIGEIVTFESEYQQDVRPEVEETDGMDGVLLKPFIPVGGNLPGDEDFPRDQGERSSRSENGETQGAEQESLAVSIFPSPGHTIDQLNPPPSTIAQHGIEPEITEGKDIRSESKGAPPEQTEHEPFRSNASEVPGSITVPPVSPIIEQPVSQLRLSPSPIDLGFPPQAITDCIKTTTSESQLHALGERIRQEEVRQISIEQPGSPTVAPNSLALEKFAQLSSPIVESTRPPDNEPQDMAKIESQSLQDVPGEEQPKDKEGKFEDLYRQMEDGVYPLEASGEMGSIEYPVFAPQQSHTFKVSDPIDLKRNEITVEVSQPATEAQEEVTITSGTATDPNDIIMAPSKPEEPAFPLKFSTSQIEISAVGYDNLVSDKPITEQAEHDMEQLPLSIVLPGSPLYSPRESKESPPATPVSTFGDVQEYLTFPSSRSAPDLIPAQPKEETNNSGMVDKTVSQAINLNKENFDKTVPPSEVPDQVPDQSVVPETTCTAVEDLGPEPLSETPAKLPTLVESSEISESTTTSPNSTMGKAKEIVEEITPQHESAPMQASLSEGSKKKSKKARQREAKKKRRSLQGTDASGPPVVVTETIRVLGSAEAPPGVSVIAEPPMQLGPTLSSDTMAHASGMAASLAHKGTTVEVESIGGIESGEHVQPNGNISGILAQENSLSAIPEAGSLEDVNTITEGHYEPLMANNLIMVEPIANVEGNYHQGAKFSALSPTGPPSPEITHDIKPAAEDPSTSQHPTLQGLSLSLRFQTEVESTFAKHGSEVREILPESIVTAQLPPADSPLPSLIMESLEDSHRSSRQNTPKPVAGPPTELTTPKPPLSRSNRKADVEHLHLPSSISQNPSSDGDLPSLSPDLVTGSEYSGGVSLQLGPDTPLPNSANMPQPVDDPEDSNPNLFSFGSKAVQAIPVAQVGFRAPMFPGASKSKNFLGATDSPPQRYFSRLGGSVDIDEFDESAYDSTTSKRDDQRRSLPSTEVDAPAEGGGAKGEEGVKHEGEDRNSHNKTVITAIENETIQSNEKSASELPLLAIQSIPSEEAAPVSKEKITHPYNTENAEDPPSQTATNQATQSLSLNSKPSGALLIAAPSESSKAIPQNRSATTHTTLLVEPTPQSHNRSPTVTQPQSLLVFSAEKKGEVENTYAPPSETSTTPPLTHSSSFESATEFRKRQISIPAATDILPSPELSPYTTNSDVGVPLPISILPKSRNSSVGYLLGREAEESSSSNSKTITEASVRIAVTSPTQLLSGQDPKPPISDPSYRVPNREKTQRSPIVYSPNLASKDQSGSLQTQNSSDSLRTVINHKDRVPPPVVSETCERNSALLENPPEENLTSEDAAEKTKNSETSSKGAFSKTYESIFGGPPNLSGRKLDLPFSYPDKFPIKSLGDIDNPVPSTNPTSVAKSDLPITTERKFEDATKHNPTQPTSTTEQGFISAEDLLARLAVQPVRKLTPIPDQSIINPKLRLSSDKKMDFLKRGERRRPAPPSLRRAGSQIESPSASSEHIIFGGETPVRGKEAIKKADIYEAWGDRAGEPKSPTRPPSIRRRQSVQIVDLESRLEGLAAENTNLTQEKANVEKALGESLQRHKNDAAVFSRELETQKVQLTEKDSEIAELKKKLEYYREEAVRLSQTNDGLAATNTTLSISYKFSYAALAGKYERKREQLANLTKENSDLQASFSEVQATMENVIRSQLQEKDSELDRLRDELGKAREEVRKLQQQVLTRQDNKYIDTKDLHHFSSSCQQLFGSLKIWCNQFSSFSAGKKCIHVHRIVDEAARDRVEDVMLDDRGVRKMLKDEKRRPEVFIAITMRMIWEHVFTRYLFGLDIDERQKLLSLERTLAENGGHEAVHQWRATTLTLLSNRPTFGTKRIADSEEIVTTILNLLNYLLPPPSQYTTLALESLRNVVQHAVQLATEMRTQRAEYVMKRPPRPEYDDNGEVASSVSFKASIMQNRGAEPASDRELEAEGATVKMILFPQVIRRGNEYGENYDTEITVLPMQVLVNRSQLRSESRASNRSVGSAWRDEQQRAGASRLTPIADQSPGETPRTTPEKARVASPKMLPMIPEQTIRLVPEENLARAYPSPSAEKKRKIDNQ